MKKIGKKARKIFTFFANYATLTVTESNIERGIYYGGF